MSKEGVEAGAERLGSISMEKKMALQLSLIQLMLGEKPTHQTDEKWNEEVAGWVHIYAKKVSNLIDGPGNKHIKDLIMQGQYREASGLVMKILKEEETKMAA